VTIESIGRANERTAFILAVVPLLLLLLSFSHIFFISLPSVTSGKTTDCIAIVSVCVCASEKSCYSQPAFVLQLDCLGLNQPSSCLVLISSFSSSLCFCSLLSPGSTLTLVSQREAGLQPLCSSHRRCLKSFFSFSSFFSAVAPFPLSSLSLFPVCSISFSFRFSLSFSFANSTIGKLFFGCCCHCPGDLT